MANLKQGFTVIELVIVIAILGILASLAVSTYQTYVVRSQISEALEMAAAVKLAVTAAYENAGSAPTDRVTAGLTPDPADTSGTYISQLDVNGGRIDITFGGPQAHAEIVGDTLSLTPYQTGDESVVWRCGNALTPPAGALMAGGSGHQNASVDPRYLPAECRR